MNLDEVQKTINRLTEYRANVLYFNKLIEGEQALLKHLLSAKTEQRAAAPVPAEVEPKKSERKRKRRIPRNEQFRQQKLIKDKFFITIGQGETFNIVDLALDIYGTNYTKSDYNRVHNIVKLLRQEGHVIKHLENGKTKFKRVR